jgi:uncharacterized protein DUF2851
MKEQLLQFIWKFQYFNGLDLKTESGESLQVIAPGEHNTHQGPDFLGAGIRIGNTLWAGNIELHVQASGWNRHAHETDKHYRNVILHVVWENDLPAEKQDGTGLTGNRNIPVLVLGDRIPKWLLGQYKDWMKSQSFAACEGQVMTVDEKIWIGWRQELLRQRLIRKSAYIGTCLQQNRQHWDETTWWLLAKTMGGPINGASFEAIAKSLPLSLLGRYGGRPEQLEALLLGQAGLLEPIFQEEYPAMLQKEFRYLHSKHQLPDIHQPVLQLRMRPGNLPAVRLAQLASLLSRSMTWFARIKEAVSPWEIFDVQEGDEKDNGGISAGPFWDRHYTLTDTSGVLQRKRIGDQMLGSIIINVFSPLLFAYGSLRSDHGLIEKSVRWLEEAPAERNSLIAGWGRLGVVNQDAADSQALLELSKYYCKTKRCLECAVGRSILGRGDLISRVEDGIPKFGGSNKNSRFLAGNSG